MLPKVHAGDVRPLHPTASHVPLSVVLLVDGHPSHKTPEVGEYCRDHGIILYKFHAHSTHLLQPCDLAIFKSLKAAWYKAEREYRPKNMIFVMKATFAAVFKPAWDAVTATPSLAVNGFREAGIYPFTREYRRENPQVASVFIRPTPTDFDESDESSVESLMVEDPSFPHTHIPVEEPKSPEGSVSINHFLERPRIPYNLKRRREIEHDALSGEDFLRKANKKQRKKKEEEEGKRKRKKREERKKARREEEKRKNPHFRVEVVDQIGL